MFWGLIMEPGKKYSQTVEKSFHVSQAALDLDTAQNDCVQVLLGFESRNYLLCTLQKNKWVQSNLDLNFQAGDSVSFATNGPGHVHLTGYLVPEDDYDYMDEEEEDEEVPSLVDMSSKKRKASEIIKKEKTGKPFKKSKTELLLEQFGEADSDDSDDSDVNTDVLGEESDVEEEEEEEDGAENDGDEESEEEEQVQKPVKSPKKESSKDVMKSPKGESPKQNGVAKTPKSEKKQQKQAAEKTPKGEKQQKVDKTPKSAKPPKSPTSSTKKVEGGVIVEDLVVGEGQQIKSGKYATVFYEGRLKTNNKVFDSSLQGAGFRFRLGKQEVIKAWDIGVSGMKVGGKRRIICPPNMAYGAQGSPPVIPPNSTLIFEVELKKIG